jgi:hypothetical protein
LLYSFLPEKYIFMKRFFFLLAIGAALAAGCQQPSGSGTAQTTDTAIATDTVPSADVPQGPQCFIQVVGRDTALLQFEIVNDSVNGRLEYRRYEKDSNKGEIKGSFHDQLLDVQYHFMSEGVMSTNAAVFRLAGDSVFAGQPSGFDKEGQPVFARDPGYMKYDSVAFVRRVCE